MVTIRIHSVVAVASFVLVNKQFILSSVIDPIESFIPPFMFYYHRHIKKLPTNHLESY